MSEVEFGGAVLLVALCPSVWARGREGREEWKEKT